MLSSPGASTGSRKTKLDEKKQINTAEFSKIVMQSALVHLLKSCETDDTDRNKFNSVEYGALTAFSDIIGKYIETVGMSSTENAAASGRSVTNMYDVLSAFSTTTSPPLTVEALYDYAAESDLSCRMDRRVEDFPAKKKRRVATFGEMIGDRQIHSQHILPFLPQYPPRHTYIHTKTDVLDRDEDPKKIHEKRLEQHAALKDSITAYAKSGIESTKSEGGDSKGDMLEGKNTQNLNPFITPAVDSTSTTANTSSNESGASKTPRKRRMVGDLL